ncbi:nucleotide pyrophosphatase [Jiangella ureilytica]|uniref:Nucleotide pyrophosphatase n=1 Tax=Jiangella ureilytica TaxID=2530374 RepID=A0A4R4RRJ6_9ACTN|nr:alkaline phosphatase family protein [Jiangella ureilytica]TDC51362.1 nucleotide pyrophosphatase [Jiangella ureilytica]
MAWPEDGDGQRGVVVMNAAGSARLRPGEPDEVLAGRNPVADQDPMAFLPYGSEVADPSPPNERNAYPYAAERLLSVFADPARSPDLVVVHTPRHYFPELGGHRGEHGSLDVIQSRAPLLLSGPGVRVDGMVADHARLRDIGPTLAWLAGVDPSPSHGRLSDAHGEPLDGVVLDRLVGRGARWVVGILWDGAHCGDLLDQAAAGRLPNVARLLSRGGALTGGAVAEFPSLTLANHTSILTGAAVGRHGVLGNLFLDRTTGRRIDANDSTTWHRWPEWARRDVPTVFEQVAAVRPDALTACVNEPADRGAGYSTMQLIRQSGTGDGSVALAHLMPDAAASPYLGNRAHLADDYYTWATRADDVGLQQVLGLWESAAAAPALMWWASAVTDAGHHAGGPRSAIARDSLADSDRRLGAFLDRLDALGVADDVVVLLTADHGFEAADPGRTGGWDQPLRAAGLEFDDIGPGFIYLGAMGGGNT